MASRVRNQLAPFEPQAFHAIVELCIRAGQAEEPAVLHPRAQARRPQNPFYKAAKAAREQLALNGDAFESAMTRFAALMALYTGGVLGPWVRSTPTRSGTSDIHPAVIDVAAWMRPSRNGKFPVRKFLQAVEATAQQRYAELEGWETDVSPAQPGSAS